MPNSTFILAEIPASLRVVPHLRSPELKVNSIYPYHRADTPASFLHTTVVDMCHWGSTALNHGRYRNQSILSPDSFDLMWTAVAKRGSSPSMYEEMGLGWSLGHYKGVKTVSHGGGGFGWNAFLLILPEKDYAAVILCNEESNAHVRATRAVADMLIGEKPQANSVSWMIPISRALAEGGIQAAYARYAEIKARKDDDEFFFQEYELINLAWQLFTAKKTDLAIEVLELNIHVYPEYIESYLEQANLYLYQGDIVQAKESLLKALSIEPNNVTATRLLEKVQ
jgi:CubicO group peptidase (beta-lactamase class C family)